MYHMVEYLWCCILLYYYYYNSKVSQPVTHRQLLLTQVEE